jgi:L-alanine-DL-glutamate epimerase-like enolase superfamily enzyme
MKPNRRTFCSTVIAGGIGASARASGYSTGSEASAHADYSALDKALQRPVLRRELFASPVIIESLELLQDRNSFLYRVRSKGGAEGISVGHPKSARDGYPMFKTALYDIFKGKDARDLDAMMTEAHEGNLKRQGIPLCLQMAGIEFAILDMLGNIANKPLGALIGGVHHPKITIYLGTRFTDLRVLEPEVSLDLVEKDLLESKARAIKLRAGLGDNMGSDIDNAPGRTEKLIKMARQRFGDKRVLMIDGNGSYTAKEAIRIGRILEEHKYYFYEEPTPWDWYEEQKQVADALTIPMAGGEEEFGVHAYRWLIANHAFDIIQPDVFYNGGMIRSMRVAHMAEAAGKTIVAHLSSGGLGYIYLLHYVSACKNAGPYQEFKLFDTKDPNGNTIPIESKREPVTSEDGIVNVPIGSGLGVTIDPAYVTKHKVLFG